MNNYFQHSPKVVKILTGWHQLIAFDHAGFENTGKTNAYCFASVFH